MLDVGFSGNIPNTEIGPGTKINDTMEIVMGFRWQFVTRNKARYGKGNRDLEKQKEA